MERQRMAERVKGRRERWRTETRAKETRGARRRDGGPVRDESAKERQGAQRRNRSDSRQGDKEVGASLAQRRSARERQRALT